MIRRQKPYRILLTCVAEGALLVTQDQDVPRVELMSLHEFLRYLRDERPQDVRRRDIRGTSQDIYDDEGVQVLTIDLPSRLMRVGRALLEQLGCEVEWVGIEDLDNPTELLEDVLDSGVTSRENAPAFRSRAEALAVLQISDADARDPRILKSAYRKRAFEAHPDRGGSEAEMKLVNNAYQYLESGQGATATATGSAGGGYRSSARTQTWGSGPQTWGPERESPRGRLTDPWTRLPSDMVQTYHKELAELVRERGLDVFRITEPIAARSNVLRVCCGGSTQARIRGFAEMFNTTETSVERDGVAANNSLIGCMNAQEIHLIFLDRDDFWRWWADGVEAQFLHLLKPINQGITYAIRFLNARPPQDREIEIFLAVRTLLGGIGNTVVFETDPRSRPSNTDRSRGIPVTPEFGGMVMIPSGEFGGIRIDKPFLISQGEVTQALYSSVMGVNPSEFSGADRPVEMVSWYDMLQLSNELSGSGACYTNIGSGKRGSATWISTCTGFRLPTESEWEYAARAFSPFTYSGSGNVGEVGWYLNNSNRQTHAAGQLKPNAFGTYDMSGNVFEWCWDLYDRRDTYRVQRGGSWYSGEGYLRAASRGLNTPEGQYSNYGGRLARSLNETPDPRLHPRVGGAQ